MAKPETGFIPKTITMHPEIKDEVVEFAKKRSQEVINGKTALKNIAVITPNYRDFNVHKLHNEAVGDPQNFIHVSSLKDIDKIKWNDYVKLATRIKMPDVDKIVKEIENIINNGNK